MSGVASTAEHKFVRCNAQISVFACIPCQWIFYLILPFRNYAAIDPRPVNNLPTTHYHARFEFLVASFHLFKYLRIGSGFQTKMNSDI